MPPANPAKLSLVCELQPSNHHVDIWQRCCTSPMRTVVFSAICNVSSPHPYPWCKKCLLEWLAPLSHKNVAVMNNRLWRWSKRTAQAKCSASIWDCVSLFRPLWNVDATARIAGMRTVRSGSGVIWPAALSGFTESHSISRVLVISKKLLRKDGYITQRRLLFTYLGISFVIMFMRKLKENR